MATSRSTLETSAPSGNGGGRYGPRTGDKSVADLIKGVFANVQDMIRSEVRLAKAELKEEAVRASAGARTLGMAAVLGFYAGMFLLAGVCLFLSFVLPLWGASLVLGTLLGIVGFAMFRAGSKTLKAVHPTPDKTIASVKENVAWLKNQTR